jgi:hypothetical protein
LGDIHDLAHVFKDSDGDELLGGPFADLMFLGQLQQVQQLSQRGARAVHSDALASPGTGRDEDLRRVADTARSVLASLGSQQVQQDETTPTGPRPTCAMPPPPPRPAMAGLAHLDSSASLSSFSLQHQPQGSMSAPFMSVGPQHGPFYSLGATSVQQAQLQLLHAGGPLFLDPCTGQITSAATALGALGTANATAGGFQVLATTTADGQLQLLGAPQLQLLLQQGVQVLGAPQMPTWTTSESLGRQQLAGRSPSKKRRASKPAAESAEERSARMANGYTVE